MNGSAQFAVLLERATDGFGVSVPDLPCCTSHGRTRDEALANICEAIEGHLETMKVHGEQIPVPTSIVGLVEVQLPAARTSGKSSDPDFEAVKVYLRKSTRKLASRKWEDETEGDFSDLVESLLADYLSSAKYAVSK